MRGLEEGASSGAVQSVYKHDADILIQSQLNYEGMSNHDRKSPQATWARI